MTFRQSPTKKQVTIVAIQAVVSVGHCGIVLNKNELK